MPKRPCHRLDEGGGVRLEVVVERALGERRADDVEAVLVGGVEHGVHRPLADEHVVVEQHDPIGVGEQRALRPGAAAAEVDGVAHRADLGMRRQPGGRAVAAAVVDDQDRVGRRAVREQALDALRRVAQLVEDGDDDQ